VSEQRPVWYNRLIFLLALFALFAAATLLASHSLRLMLPCSEGGGCADVAHSEYAHMFGIPVAAYGVALDLLFLVLCVIRVGLEDRRWRTATLLLWSAGAVGVAFSARFTYISAAELHAVCDWCLGHAVAVTLIWLFATAEYARATRSQATGARLQERKLLWGGVAVGVVVTLGYVGYLYEAAPRDKFATVRYEARIIRDDSWSRGARDAPVTVVEFADFQCPSCESASRFMTNLLKHHPGKARHVYRHHVLYRSHLQAQVLAEIVEWAGTKGKFWEMYHALFAEPDHARIGDYLPYAKLAGLDPAELDRFLKARREDRTGPRYKAFLRTYQDYKDGQALGVNATPTFFVLVKWPGEKVPRTYRAGSIGALQRVLQQKEIARVLGEPTSD
jgi:uncharacterized membrane protein